METTRIGRRGTVVIPVKLRRQLGLDEGDVMVAEAVDDGVLLRPAAATVAQERQRVKEFFRRADAEYERMQKDPQEWAEYLAEIKEFEGTLMDGLDDEPWEAGPEPS
jgi:AbrB family looped-hinge helix DNA binding protein